MSWHSLKYFVALSLPVYGIFTQITNGWATFIPIAYSFIVIPFLEIVMPPDARNLYGNEKENAKKNILYDLILYSAGFGHLIAFYLFITTVSNSNIDTLTLCGRTASLGLMCGAIGINVAHELGHRNNTIEQWYAKLLLMTSLYMHFFIEHNRGHHKYVGTPSDAATAKKGQNLYVFLAQTVVGSYLSAWKIENNSRRKKGLTVYGIGNEMLQMHIIQFVFLAVLNFFFGFKILMLIIIAAAIGIFLLETINYIEHYGLYRKEINPGIYERVMPWHSWNSNHVLGRIVLFELTRHSDHHYLANRKYQLLENIPEAPTLPTGYPGMMILSLVPPLWFKVVHKRMQQLELAD